MSQAFGVLKKLYSDYEKTTPQKLKIIDVYMFYILLTGIAQFVYCLFVGTFPFNSFLSGFISSVTSFVLASCLRIQVNDENKSEFAGISQERAFADFILAHVILHLVVANFLVRMIYMKPFRFVKNAATNPNFFKSYGAYGAGGFLLAIYFCEWKTIGKFIPLWNSRYVE